MRKVRFFGLLTLIVALAAMPVLRTSAEELQDTENLPPPFAQKPTGPMAKASSALRQLVGEFLAYRGDPDRFRPSNEHLQYAPGHVVIDVVASGDPVRLMEVLRGLGMTHAAQAGPIVSGLFPIGAIQRMLQLDSVRAVRAAWQPMMNAGLVTSEGVYAMGIDPFSPPFTGLGSTIGILSDSFDQKGGMAQDQANDDLPASVALLDDSANCGNILVAAPCTDEGRGMGQLAHDVAPGANMAFHTAFNGQANFAQGIRDLAAAGSDVIADDVTYFAEPMFQDGVIAQAIDDVVANGVAYFSAAGNSARKSYESAFSGSGEILYVNTLFGQVYRGELHDFNPDPSVVDWRQGLTIPPGVTIYIALQWDQPSSAVSPGHGSQSDVDIYLANGSAILASSKDDNIASGMPVEVLSYTNSGTTEQNVDLMITHYDGPEAGLMKYVMFGGLNVSIEYATDSPTLYGHANAAGAEAVGAAFYQNTPYYGVAPPLLEWFSSAGGVPILFDTNGLALSDTTPREKPEIVAPDGANTTFFYADSASDADDWPNFFGTSAAAPHAAGVAALLREANASATPAEIYTALESTATNMNDPGFDNDSGYGFVSAPDAIAAIGGGTVTVDNPPIASFDSTCSGLDCSFTDMSTDDGTIMSWLWNFGDGVTTTAQNPSHTYPSAGDYTVTLTVTDDGNNVVSTSQSISPSSPGTGTPDACDGLSDGVYFAVQSANDGRTWTATVEATNCVGGNIADFVDPSASWFPLVGTVGGDCSSPSSGVCQASQSGIRKRIASVDFTISGVTTTITKP